MKEVQDERWIGKMRELLEDYRPSDQPGDFEQVRRRLVRPLPWYRRIFRKPLSPWLPGALFCAGVLTGFLLFHSRQEPEPIPPTQVSHAGESDAASMIAPTAPAPAVMSVEKVKPQAERPAANIISSPPATGTAVLIPPESVTAPDEATFTEDQANPALITVRDTLKPSPDTVVQNRLPVGDPLLQADTVTSLPADGTPAGDQAVPTTKRKKPKIRPDLPLPSFSGDPWKAGLGYSYQSMLSPDTGKALFREFNLRFSNELFDRFSAGGGISAGRTAWNETVSFRVIDRSVADSTGNTAWRDSIVQEDRYQQHAALTLTARYDLFRRGSLNVPFTAGASFGWCHNRSYSLRSDGQLLGSLSGKPAGFTGFISADIGLGLEWYLYKGVSLEISALYRRMLVGPEMLGYRKNFLGGTILLNLDFDAKRWNKP